MKQELESLGKRFAIGVPLAFLMSVVLWWTVIPLPIKAIFGLLFFFLSLQPMNQYFGEGTRMVLSWVAAFFRAAVALVTFTVLLFLTSQVTQVYPADAYDAWGKWGRYGHGIIIWGHQAPFVVVREIVILATLAGMVWGWSRDRKWAKRLLVFLWLIFIVWAIFPHRESTWPAKADTMDNSLAARQGVAAMVAPSSERPATNAQSGNQFCGEGAQNFAQTKTGEVSIALHQNGGCYRGPIAFPKNWDGYRIFLSRNPGDWAQVWCDGQATPRPKRSGDEKFGGDFYGCMSSHDITTTFFARGQGTILFRATTYR